MLRDGSATLAGAMLALATYSSFLRVDASPELPLSGGPDCSENASGVALLQVRSDRAQPVQVSEHPANGALNCATPDFSLLDEAYHGNFRDIDDRAYYYKEEDFKAKGQGDAEVYGEIKPGGVVDLLCKVGARPGHRFYDLGSGTGKTVAIAWLLGMQAQGVELSEDRWRLSCNALGNLTQAARPADAGKELKFIQGSVLETDFSDADVVFADSVLFPEKMMHQLAKIASGMREGAQVITYKEFPGPWFKTVMKAKEPCSWGPELTEYAIQERVSHKIAPKAATRLSQPQKGKHCSL